MPISDVKQPRLAPDKLTLPEPDSTGAQSGIAGQAVAAARTPGVVSVINSQALIPFVDKAAVTSEQARQLLDDPKALAEKLTAITGAVDDSTSGARNSPIVYGKLVQNVRLPGLIGRLSASSATFGSIMRVEDAANFYDGQVLELSVDPFCGPRKVGSLTVATGGGHKAIGQVETTVAWATGVPTVAEFDYIFESEPNDAIGTISAGVGTATVTLTSAADANNFFVGQRVEVSAAANTYQARRTGLITVTAVNVGAGTVTGHATWNVAIGGAINTDKIYVRKPLACSVSVPHRLTQVPNGVLLARVRTGSVAPRLAITAADTKTVTITSTNACLADLYFF